MRWFCDAKAHHAHELGEIYKYPSTLPLSTKQKLNIAQNICVVISEVHQAGLYLATLIRSTMNMTQAKAEREENNMLKFCKKCGASVPAQTTFCNKCGSQMQNPNAAGSPPNVAGGNQTVPNAPVAQNFSSNVCNMCGSQITPGTRFCKKCSAPIAQMPHSPPQHVVPHLQNTPPAGKSSSKIVKALKICGIALAALVILGIIGSIVGDDPTDQQDALDTIVAEPGVQEEPSPDEADPSYDEPAYLPEVALDEPITAVELFERYAHAVFTIRVSGDGVNFHSAGSGFIIDPDGLAVTAHHCLGAPFKRARLHDGSEVDILGFYNYDTTNDLAVIRLDGSNHAYVRLGDPRDLRVGEEVFAIGSTGGLGRMYYNTLSTGIHSAVVPSFLFSIYNIVNAIQITAPTYGGNSGGPIFNYRGQVVGVLVGGPRGNPTIGIASPVYRLDLSPHSLSVLTPFAGIAYAVEVIDVSAIVGTWVHDQELIRFFADGTGIWEHTITENFQWTIDGDVLVAMFNGDIERFSLSVRDYSLITISGINFHRIREDIDPNILVGAWVVPVGIDVFGLEAAIDMFLFNFGAGGLGTIMTPDLVNLFFWSLDGDILELNYIDGPFDGYVEHLHIRAFGDEVIYQVGTENFLIRIDESISSASLIGTWEMAVDVSDGLLYFNENGSGAEVYHDYWRFFEWYYYGDVLGLYYYDGDTFHYLVRSIGDRFVSFDGIVLRRM